MKQTLKTVKIESIIIGENVRIPNNLKLDTLADSIETNGLQEPIWLRDRNGEMRLVKGHRRMAAIALIKGRNVKRYEELFSAGIPAIVVSGITDIEEVLLKCDHDGQEGLSSEHELQRTANMLFAAGKTEAEVIALTSGLMDKVSPMSASARKEYNDLLAKAAACKAGSNEQIAAQKEADARRLDYRRGKVQGIHNAFRAPSIVMHALYRQEVGVAPEGVIEYLPPLTTVQVTKLWNAHKDDLSILENGIPKYSKERVGPLFTEKWNAIVSAAKETEGKPKEKRDKAMSASDMKDEIAGRGFNAELTCKLIQYHAGDKSVSGELPDLDKAAHYSDMLRKYDVAMWETVVKAAQVIEARLRASDKAPAVTATK